MVSILKGGFERGLLPTIVKSILRAGDVLLELGLEYADYNLIAISCLDVTTSYLYVSTLGSWLGS